MSNIDKLNTRLTSLRERIKTLQKQERELAQQNSFQLVSKFLGGSDEPAACFNGGEEGLSYSS